MVTIALCTKYNGLTYIVDPALLVSQLSHEAFKVAQSLEPLYVNCWIGQVLENHTHLNSTI